MKTFDFSKIVTLFGLASFLFLFSCEPTVDRVNPTVRSTQDQNLLRTEFTKNLAKALSNESIRKFIKAEALKKFDGDHDVFFHAVKNNNVVDGKKFSEILATYASSNEQHQLITNSLPLLNILVPTLKKASAEAWNTETEVPWVAVMNSESWSKTVTQLDAYDSEGNKHSISKIDEPDRLVILVQDSERIIVKAQNSANARLGDKDYLFSDNGNNYYSPYYHPQNVSGARSMVDFPTTSTNPHLYALFNNSSCPRDIIYKNINDATYQGYFPYSSVNVREKLRSIKFANNQTIASAADNWTEQTLELRFTLAYAQIQPARVETHVSGSFITTSNLLSGDGSYPIEYSLGNIDLINWGKNELGDRMKISIIEYDNGDVTTVSLTFGSKFSAGISVGTPQSAPVAVSVNASGEETISQTLQIQSTNNSEVLGDVELNFCEYYGSADGFFNGYIYLKVSPSVPGYY